MIVSVFNKIQNLKLKTLRNKFYFYSMRIITIVLLFFSISFLSGQDTLRVMHYNLLYYGESTGFCNWNNNNPDQKDAWLRTVVSYVKPDIFTVNEISRQSTYQQRILSEVMNQTGYAFFEMAQSPNYSDSRIVNQLYFNSEKLELHSQSVTVHQDSIRDIDIYSLYYLNDQLLEGDTIFIHCIVAHLKAGTSSSDKIDRKNMTQNVLDYLESNGRSGNYFFMGDFNVYDAAEDAFQLMISNNDPVFRFYDPVDEIGDWHESPSFRHVHTQSTHVSTGYCHSGGGMDDRFDFILMNEIVNSQDDKIYYLEGTYRALGQDGSRLNGSLIDPPNTSLPAYVLDALYNMSDHLPVVMDVVVDESLGTDDIGYLIFDIRYANPVKDELKLYFSQISAEEVMISLHSTSGAVVYQEQCYLSGNTTLSVPTNDLPSGMYILYCKSERHSFVGKVIVIH